MARNSPQSLLGIKDGRMGVFKCHTEGTLQHKIAGGRVGREYINIL